MLGKVTSRLLQAEVNFNLLDSSSKLEHLVLACQFYNIVPSSITDTVMLCNCGRESCLVLPPDFCQGQNELELNVPAYVTKST